MVSVSAPAPTSLSSPEVALSVVLPILGLLILLGIWVICKQKRSKGNLEAVGRDVCWDVRGARGVGDCDCSGKRPTEIDVDMEGGRPCELKTGPVIYQGLTWQREWNKPQRSSEQSCEFSPFDKLDRNQPWQISN